MGAAWCRERAAKAQDSKSPFDRVIVKCVNQMSLSESQGVQNNIQNHTTRPTKNVGNPHVEADSGWQDVVLRVPDEAPVPPPRKKRRNLPIQKALPPPPPPRTPSIHLEVDTPETRPRSTSLEVASSLSRQKSRSFNCLPSQVDQEKMEDPAILRPPRSASSMSNRSIATLSDATSERLDNYLKSCRSFGSLKPEDLIHELNQALQSGDSSDSDAWAGIDDWDLGIPDHHTVSGTPPLTPTSQLPDKKGRKRAVFTVGDGGDNDKPEPRRKVKNKKVSPDASGKGNSPPTKFQSSVKTSSKVATTLIKPEQIPVKDFLRHSEKSSLHEKRRGDKLSVDLSPSNSFTFDFSRGGLAPPHSPQITLPGTPCTPRSLSRCVTPLPPQCRDACVTPPSSPTEDINTASLLRLLNEYHAAAELIGDDDARKILQSVGIPENLNDELEHRENAVIESGKTSTDVDADHAVASSNSGRSSTNQSLAELETALSEFLEASQAKRGEDDDDEEDEEVAHTSAFTPIKQEPPFVTPRKKMSLKEANPEITITTATEDKPLTEVNDVKIKKLESAFTPIAHVSAEKKEADKQSMNETKKEDGTKEDVKINDAHETKDSTFEPIKEAHDVKPVITITIAAEEVDKKEDDHVKTYKVSPVVPPSSEKAFQVTVSE